MFNGMSNFFNIDIVQKAGVSWEKCPNAAYADDKSILHALAIFSSK